MKTFGCFRWLLAAAVAASLPVAAQAAPGHTMGGFAGSGSHHNMGGSPRGGRPVFMGARPNHSRFFDHRFADHGRFFDHRFVDHDHFFHHHHHNNFIFVFDFAAFGFPWWYPDGYWYPYYSPYDGYYGYGADYDADYWTQLAVSVQSKLAEHGYYHGAIDGEIGSGSRQAIRAFQAAEGLPVTGLIDPRLLKALGIKYRTA